MKEFIVSHEVLRPFRSSVLGVFGEEILAVQFAEEWMAFRSGHRSSRRLWTILTSDANEYLVVWERKVK